MSLWLVRHGATEWTEQGRLCGWTDVQLSPGGRAQADLLRHRLADHRFDGTWTSDLGRAAEFARLVWGHAGPDPRLRELDFGELEGRAWSDLSPQSRRALVRFDGFSAPGGESVAQLEERVSEFLGDLDRGKHLIFTHGGVIRLLSRRRGLTSRAEPGQLTVLELEGTMAVESRSKT